VYSKYDYDGETLATRIEEERDRLAQIARDEDDEADALKLMSEDEREDVYQAARLESLARLTPMAAATSWAEAMSLTVASVREAA